MRSLREPETQVLFDRVRPGWRCGCGRSRSWAQCGRCRWRRRWPVSDGRCQAWIGDGAPSSAALWGPGWMGHSPRRQNASLRERRQDRLIVETHDQMWRIILDQSTSIWKGGEQDSGALQIGDEVMVRGWPNSVASNGSMWHMLLELLRLLPWLPEPGLSKLWQSGGGQGFVHRGIPTDYYCGLRAQSDPVLHCRMRMAGLPPIFHPYY